MKALFPSVFFLLSLSACAANNANPVAHSVVTVSQAYTGTEEQALDTGRANSEALQRCRARGYPHAEKLGPEQQTCTRYTGYYACFYHQVDQQYQCSGGPE